MGERVFHQKFGNGNVTAVDGNKLTIRFDKAGEKRVVDSFVRGCERPHDPRRNFCYAQSLPEIKSMAGHRTENGIGLAPADAPVRAEYMRDFSSSLVVAGFSRVLLQDVVGDPERVDHRRGLVEHLEQPVVRDDDGRVAGAAQHLGALVGLPFAPRSLEFERERDDPDRERAELA